MTVGCWLIIFIQEYRSQVQYSESLKLLWLCVNSLVGIHGTVDATFDSSVSATQLLNIWPLVNMYSTKVTFIYSSPVARSYVDAVKQKMTSKVQAIIQRIQFKKPPNDACRGKYLPTFGTASDTLVLCCWGIHGLVFYEHVKHNGNCRMHKQTESALIKQRKENLQAPVLTCQQSTHCITR